MKSAKTFCQAPAAALIIAAAIACAAPAAWCETGPLKAESDGAAALTSGSKLSLRDGRRKSVFDQAERAFPAFCNDWESKLKGRERNNLDHISWQESRGYETGSYVGYGGITSCICKQSTRGVPIGKVTYQEFDYYLQGKTLDEARRGVPKTAGITNTTEIFRWDQKKKSWIWR